MPIRMDSLIHNNPSRRKTWYENAVKGWVLITSNKYNRC